MTVRFMISGSLLVEAQAASQPGPAITWSARAPEPFRNASDGTTECQSASGMVLARPGVSGRGQGAGEASYWFRGGRPLCCHVRLPPGQTAMLARSAPPSAQRAMILPPRSLRRSGPELPPPRALYEASPAFVASGTSTSRPVATS
jgi:hypothetical protein